MRRAVCRIDENGITGTVCFSQPDPDSPVRIRIDLKGLSDNAVHAVHIHEYGDTRDGCTSLGGHWNPRQTNHGCRDWTPTRHAGDLINNICPRNGEIINRVFFDKSITLSGDESILGRSVVIHESPDDMGLNGIPLYVEGSTRRPPVYLYRDMSQQDLMAVIQQRNLTTDLHNSTREQLVAFLEKGSATTGNAGRRLACGIIGHAK